MGTLKSKKLWLQIAALVLVAVVAMICKQFEVEDETTEFILNWIFKLAGLSIGAHAAADVTSMIKGLQKKKDV